MRSPTPFALSCVLLAGCAGTTLPDGPIFSQRLFPQHDVQLPSGLRVVVQEDHSTPLVVVAAVYNTGAADDPAGASGLAHLVEHLAFRARDGKAPLAERLKHAGATFNALTRVGSTTYYAVAHRDALPELLALEGERLGHPLAGVTAQDLEIERKVVINEGRQRQLDASAPRVLSELQAQLFPAGHPLAQSINGTDQSLASLTLPLAREFVRAHYRPDNCALVIAGDVKVSEVAAMMDRWPAEALTSPDGSARHPHRPWPVGAKASPPPPLVSTAPRTLKLPGTDPKVMLAWSLPGLSRDNRALMSLTDVALHAAARMAGARSQLWLTPQGSVALVETTRRKNESADAVRTRLLDVVTSERAVTAGRQSTPFARRTALARLVRASGDPVASGLLLADHVGSTGRASVYADTVEQVVSTEANDLSAFLRRYIARDRAVTLFVEVDETAVAAAEGDAPGGEERHQLDQASDYDLGAMTGKDLLRIMHAPRIAALPRLELPNHLRVVAIERADTPLAVVSMHLPGGDATAAPYGLATLASSLSTPCRAHPSLEVVAGALHASHGKLTTELSALVPEGNLPNALAAIADEVTCREFGSRQMQVMEKLNEVAAKAPAPSPQMQASSAFWSALYPGHPYGELPSVAALRQIERGAASTYLDRHYRPDGAVAVVVSAHPLAALQPLVSEYLADWTPAQTPSRMTPPPAPPLPAARLIRVFDSPGKKQAFLRLGCRLPAMTGDTLPAFDVLGQVLERQAAELRESWGATYGMRTTVALYPDAAHLIVAGAVETARTGEALRRLLAVLASDAAAGPDIKTFTLARWDTARGFNSRLATSEGVARAVLFASDLGWPAETWDRYPVMLANTTRAQIRALLADCAGHEVITVTGDAAALAPQLAGQGAR
jgi:zinc protease